MTSDTLAISLSGLCLIHCLALPLFVSLSPIIAGMAEAEWLHRAFVILAVPVAIFAYFRTDRGIAQTVFGLCALAGASFLMAGAFVEAWHDYETLLTVFGALLLAGAHLFRWQNRYASARV